MGVATDADPFQKHAGGGATKRVALVGAGTMADAHAAAFSAHESATLAGITSRTERRAMALADRHGIGSVCRDIAGLCRTAAPDLLVVAVDEGALAGVIAEAAPFGVPILAEKPPGLDVDDACRIAETAGAAGTSVHVALNRRHMASTRAVAADLAERGGDRFIAVEDQQSYAEAEASGKPPEVVAKYMYANAIHLVDYLTHLGRGAIARVLPVRPWDAQQPGVVVAAIEFESGDSGLYTAIWNGPAPWSVSVATPSRRWQMRPLERASYQDDGARRALSLSEDPMDTTFKPGLHHMAGEALKMLDGQPHSLTPLAEAMRTMRLIAAIYGHRRLEAGEML